MQVCVYTTNHSGWLNHMQKTCGPEDVVCFRSRRRWATAKEHLERSGPMPVLIRDTDDDAADFRCTRVAELVEVWFPEDIGGKRALKAWLEDALWLQRKGIQEGGHSDRFANWQAQFDAWEIKPCLKAQTLYCIRNLQMIDPLPLPTLIKLSNKEPLSAQYSRPYSICYYPETHVRVLQGAPPTGVPPAGGGFAPPKANKAVEDAAVAIVKDRYVNAGWKVVSVEADRCGYDLHCTKRKNEVHVEVKGLSGKAGDFTITEGEVACARNDERFVLCVVTEATGDSPTAHEYTGSEFLDAFTLKPIQYRAVARY